PPAVYTLSLHDALPILRRLQDRLHHEADAGDEVVAGAAGVKHRHQAGHVLLRRRTAEGALAEPGDERHRARVFVGGGGQLGRIRSEEHTSELQSLAYLV